MGHYWGSFADGLTRGFAQGWELGDKIGKAWKNAKYASDTEAVNKEYDDKISQVKTDHAAIDAYNSGQDVQKAVDTAMAGREAPIVPLGTREIGAYDRNQEKWRMTDNPASSEETTRQMLATNPGVPVRSETMNQLSPEQAIQLAQRGKDEGYAVAVTPDRAVPRFSNAKAEDEISALEAARQEHLDRVYRRYVANDPEKARAFAKEMEENRLKSNLKQTYVAALKGDPDAIKNIIDGINQNPRLVGFDKGDQIAPYGDGMYQLIGADGEPKTKPMSLNRELVEAGFRAYAISRRMLFDGNIDKYIDTMGKLGAERRADDTAALQREGFQLQKDKFAYQKEQDARTSDREERKFDFERRKFNVETTLKAEAAAAKNVAGGQDFKFVENPDDVTGATQLVQTKDGKTVGRTDESGQPIPLKDATKEQLAMVTEAEKKGYKAGVVYDPINNRLEFGWTDPKTGNSSSVAHPNKWFPPSDRKGEILTPDRIYDYAGGSSRQSRGALPPGTPGVAPKEEEAPAPTKEKVAETPSETEKAVKVGAAKATPVEKAVKVGAAEVPPVEKAVELPSKKEPPVKYANEKMPSQDKPAAGVGDWLVKRAQARTLDTSGYTDQQLEVINTARAKRGQEPLKAMDRPPEEESLSAMARRRNKEMDTEARVKAVQREMPTSEGTKWSTYSKEASKQRKALDDEKVAIAKRKKDEETKAVKTGRLQPLDMTGRLSDGNMVRYAPEPTKKPFSAGKRPGNESLPVNPAYVISRPGDSMGKGKNSPKQKGYMCTVPKGHAVAATRTGKIVYKGVEKGYGPFVIVEAYDGSQQIYAHINTSAKMGDKVTMGSQFAVVDDNKGLYHKKNVFFYRHIPTKEIKARDKEYKDYLKSDDHKNDKELGLA